MAVIKIDAGRCSGCGACVDFCPTSVLAMTQRADRKLARVVREKDCWACATCVGQCPEGAIKVLAETSGPAGMPASSPRFRALGAARSAAYAGHSASLEKVLGLRWKPVAVSLLRSDSAMPPVPVHDSRLRYCQSVMEALAGRTLLMPPQAHACPDGTHILGLTEIPPKLASGELYLKFGKLASIDAARQMISERPRLPGRSVLATLVGPLDQVMTAPDVIIVAAPPESIMWLCMASSYYSGRRAKFNVSGYNAICLEATLIPFTSGEPNISLGCYGCRAASDIGDDMMFMGIPERALSSIVDGLTELGRKPVLESRARVYRQGER